MNTVDFTSIARVLLERQLAAFPEENQKYIAYGLQDSYQSRGHTSPTAFGYEYGNFSPKQRYFLSSISDALMNLCIERFGELNP